MEAFGGVSWGPGGGVLGGVLGGEYCGFLVEERSSLVRDSPRGVFRSPIITQALGDVLEVCFIRVFIGGRLTPVLRTS